MPSPAWRFDGPRPVQAGVERVMKHLRAPQSDVVRAVFTEWESLVGELIAAHSRPVNVVDGTLRIEVDDPAWASELGWLADDLLERIQGRLESTAITAIEVRITR